MIREDENTYINIVTVQDGQITEKNIIIDEFKKNVLLLELDCGNIV